MSLTCPNCQYGRNPVNIEFCEACGHSLKEKTVSPSTLSDKSSRTADELMDNIGMQQKHQSTKSVASDISDYQELNPKKFAPDVSRVPSVSATSVSDQDCQICGYKNPLNSPFCGSCGSNLNELIRSAESSSSTFSNTSVSPNNAQDSNQVSTAANKNISPVKTIAKLISKDRNIPQTEFDLNPQSNLIGRFDSETGPVDIDLGEFDIADTISRHHGEIFYEGGQWKIKDLGSVNGIFIRRSGQSRFSSRILTPESLYPDDEIAIGKIIFMFQC